MQAQLNFDKIENLKTIPPFSEARQGILGEPENIKMAKTAFES